MALTCSATKLEPWRLHAGSLEASLRQRSRCGCSWEISWLSSASCFCSRSAWGRSTTCLRWRKVRPSKLPVPLRTVPPRAAGRRLHHNIPVWHHTPYRAVFSPLSVPGARLLTAKAMYVGLNLVGLGVVLWKVRAMGLLPLTSADWVSLLPQRLPLQLAAAGAPA